MDSLKSKLDSENTALYVLSFNSPSQFHALLLSMLAYDDNFIIGIKNKFLLDNSTDLTTTGKYQELCHVYGFQYIKKNNLGINGGRQFIAEHAEDSAFDVYFFFEDDMLFYLGQNTVCKNGFNRYVRNIYQKSIAIVKKNELDFLKLNFTEYFGCNETQWAWYNVPQDVREVLWPENASLPVQGFSVSPPKTNFKNIQIEDGLPFATGEVYYCNWPQVVSRSGNRKMFLETKWAHPYEQTWMSFMFQETLKGNIKPAVLLSTPTEHNRFEHYDHGLRKES
ncbi:hypothetical protein HZU77_010380 [Neisseriaceae bacterium TC5R-5]|nr:hypothetical protein [Neisseriaceae bacterium TC5R-5]